ncbi:MAG: hypothetical protein ACJ71N_04345 [Terriglobales bacterium]|jgi:hypothetical protein
MSRIVKKSLCVIAIIVFAFLGSISALNCLYNLAGLAAIRDGASGERLETAGAALLFALVVALATFVAQKLVRLMKAV